MIKPDSCVGLAMRPRRSMMYRVAITCSECGTSNPDGAAFCSMCRAIFGKRRASAAPAPAPVELARAPSAPAPPSIETRSVPLAAGWVASLAQNGSTLSVHYSGATMGGVLRATLVGAIGGAMIFAARGVSYEPGSEWLSWIVGGFGALFLGLALWSVGFSVVHRFDAASRAVERKRTWLGIPAGAWSGSIDEAARVVVEIGVAVRRYQPPVHRLKLRTASGDSLIATSTDLTDLTIVGNEVARHLGLRPPHRE